MNGEQPFDESQFAHTIVRVELNGSWVEFVPNPEAVDDAATVSPVRGIVHVISGCNPGYRESDEVNAQRHIYMEQRLRDVGAQPLPAIGMSPDGSWVEPSWGVTGLARETVCALGREFGQVAVFEIEGSRIRIIRCTDSAEVSDRGVRLRPG